MPLPILQGDQKVSAHLTITVYISGAQRLFDHPVFYTAGLPLKIYEGVSFTPNAFSGFSNFLVVATEVLIH
jgi:hypothetical protein